MINAVLVFNNNGQPRLAKFYSQIVPPPHSPRVLSLAGAPSRTDRVAGPITAAAAANADLHVGERAAVDVVQLPAAPAAPLLSLLLLLLVAVHDHGRQQRLEQRERVGADHAAVPPLRDAVLHRHQRLARVAARPARPDPGVRAGTRPAVRERVRARPHLQLRDAPRYPRRDGRRRLRRRD